VYVPEAWSFTDAGLHVPLILLSDVVGSVGTLPPAQMVHEEPNENTGAVLELTDTVKVVFTAHWPAVGVNV
jgi:hypothetical protein